MTEEERIRGAWEVYLYARALLAKRMSYGMVAQSMLLISFSTLAIGRSSGGLFVAFFHWIVAALGVIHSSYLYFRIRIIHQKLRRLEKQYFASRDLVFTEFLKPAPSQYFSRDFSQSAIIVIFVIAWLTLFVGALLMVPYRSAMP